LLAFTERFSANIEKTAVSQLSAGNDLILRKNHARKPRPPVTLRREGDDPIAPVRK
jgi:hypothetical protein